MERLDDGKRPRRRADHLAERRRFGPLKERQRPHQSGLTTQPARALTIGRCGCLSQSNQLYAIIRPATTMIAQSTSDLAPALLAARGGTGSRSHSAMRRSIVEWKTKALSPASASATTL